MIGAARKTRITPEIVWLGTGQAMALAAMDIYCVALLGTTRVYWLDAAVEATLVGAWMAIRRKQIREKRTQT
jgi:hypothetical protein